MSKERFYPTDYMPEDPGKRQKTPAQESTEIINIEEEVVEAEALNTSDAEINIVEANNILDTKNKYNEIIDLIIKLDEIDRELEQNND